jgi:Phospholipase_D-nuclease N-terminal
MPSFITRSEFTDSSNKILWILLVIFLPPLGMLLNLLIGLGQKKGKISQKEKDQMELLSRISSDKSKEGEFKIK